MSREVIENYMRTNYSKFSIDDLKKKLISGGYPKKDVDEVGAIISKEKEAVPKISKKAGFRWLRWSGVFMFIFLGIGVFNFVMGLFGGYVPRMAGVIFGVVLLIVLLVGIVILTEGWFKLSSYTNSKLMRFALFGILYTVIFLLVFSIGSVAVLWFRPDLLFALGFLNIIYIGVVLLSLGFLFVCSVLIQVALIKVRKQLRFAGWVGGLSLVSIFMWVITMILQSFFFQSLLRSSILNTGYLGGGINSSVGGSSGIVWAMLALAVIMGVISIVASILAGLMFFDASKKFEV